MAFCLSPIPDGDIYKPENRTLHSLSFFLPPRPLTITRTSFQVIHFPVSIQKGDHHIIHQTRILAKQHQLKEQHGHDSQHCKTDTVGA